MDNRKSGIALIAGSLGGTLTMAIHPTATGSLTVEQAAHLSAISGIAHSIAIISVFLLFLGACGLTQCIAAPDRLAFGAIVTFGFACIAVFVSATVSGFIVPSIMKDMVRDVPAATHQWQIVIDGIFQINQAFGRIYSVAASMAIILWSVSALRNGGFGRGGAVYGCVISMLLIVGIGVGHLHLDVHGMMGIWLGQATWFILIGSQLWSRPARGSSRQ
jgi:hypothetical protein